MQDAEPTIVEATHGSGDVGRTGSSNLPTGANHRAEIERILFENFYTGEPGEREAIKAATEALIALQT